MNFLLFVSVQTPADIASYSGYEAKPQEDFSDPLKYASVCIP